MKLEIKRDGILLDIPHVALAAIWQLSVILISNFHRRFGYQILEAGYSSKVFSRTGGIAIPGACIGIFLGGYLLKRFQLRPGGAVQLVLFFNVLCLSCYALLFFFGCENVKMAGTTMPYFR